MRKPLCLPPIIGEQAVNAYAHTIHTTCGVDAWSQNKTKILSRDVGYLPTRLLQQCQNTHTATTLLDGLDTLVHQNTIILV